MQENSEPSRLVGKTVEKKTDSALKHCPPTHWYRFDPNRPTFDQLRAAEKDSKQHSFQEKRRRIGDSIERHFRRMKRWRIFCSFLTEVQIYLSFFREKI
jgi:hypothetical protein